MCYFISTATPPGIKHLSSILEPVIFNIPKLKHASRLGDGFVTYTLLILWNRMLTGKGLGEVNPSRSYYSLQQLKQLCSILMK
jgi:hypothetical protein